MKMEIKNLPLLKLGAQAVHIPYHTTRINILRYIGTGYDE